MSLSAFRLALPVAVGCALSLSARPCSANPDYLAAFRGTYPSCTIPDELAISSSACYTCHNANAFFGDWNCYRRDLISRLRAGRTIAQAIRDIETWDSDGDGTNNITEILFDRGGGLVGYNPGLVGPLGVDPCVTGVNGSGVPRNTLPVTFRQETPPPTTGACCWGVICTIATPAQCVGATRRFVAHGTACNAPSSLITPCCAADFNQNTIVNIDDLFIYLNAWFDSSPSTNVFGDGFAGPSIDDLFVYLNAWFVGC